jgi:hypothetical protein
MKTTIRTAFNVVDFTDVQYFENAEDLLEEVSKKWHTRDLVIVQSRFIIDFTPETIEELFEEGTLTEGFYGLCFEGQLQKTKPKLVAILTPERLREDIEDLKKDIRRVENLLGYGISDRFSYDAVTGGRSGGGLYESIINEARSSKELIGSFLDGLKIVKEVVKSIDRKYKVKEISIGEAYERLSFVSSPVVITVSKTIEDVEDIKKIIDKNLVDNIKVQGNKIILSLIV